MRRLLAIVCLVAAGGCLAPGCGTMKAAWEADDVAMSTQFELSWGTSIKIGFPGTVRGSASGEGEKALKAAPE